MASLELHNLQLTHEEKIKFSVKDLVFLQVPVVCCIGKINQGSTKEKRGASLLKTTVFTHVLGTM
jgi:hypothetical protein